MTDASSPSTYARGQDGSPEPLPGHPGWLRRGDLLAWLPDPETGVARASVLWLGKFDSFTARVGGRVVSSVDEDESRFTSMDEAVGAVEDTMH